jgi:hypothetical protein
LVVVRLEACKDRLRRVAPYVLYQACKYHESKKRQSLQIS